MNHYEAFRSEVKKALDNIYQRHFAYMDNKKMSLIDIQ